MHPPRAVRGKDAFSDLEQRGVCGAATTLSELVDGDEKDDEEEDGGGYQKVRRAARQPEGIVLNKGRGARAEKACACGSITCKQRWGGTRVGRASTPRGGEVARGPFGVLRLSTRP
jgi:hypothetical protein